MALSMQAQRATMKSYFSFRAPGADLTLLPPQGTKIACGCAGTGRLRFNWSNVCMHYFSTAFLADMAARMRTEARYHLARKAIPSASGPVQVGCRKGVGDDMSCI